MLRLAFTGLLIMTIMGCSSISGVPERSIDVKAELHALQPYFEPKVVANYDALPTNAEKKRYRNEVISARLRGIDLNFTEFVKNITSENRKLNIGFDTAVLILGGAGAISTVSSTQAIIAATSTTVSGVKTTIDKNAYYDASLTALISQMHANRQQTLIPLYRGMDAGIDRYPLMRALIDVENYFHAGTVMGAINAITKQAGVAKAKYEEELANLLKTSYTKAISSDSHNPDHEPPDNNNDLQNE